jgi:hypothetical protein
MDLLRHVELHAIEAEYWYEVDHHAGRGASALYQANGTFIIGDNVFRGRDEINGFYRRREERGARTARHAIANPRISAVTGDTTTFEYIMLLYAADGVPVLEANAPVLIADVTVEYVRTAGMWIAGSRNLKPVFEGGTGAIKT